MHKECVWSFFPEDGMLNSPALFLSMEWIPQQILVSLVYASMLQDLKPSRAQSECDLSPLLSAMTLQNDPTSSSSIVCKGNKESIDSESTISKAKKCKTIIK